MNIKDATNELQSLRAKAQTEEGLTTDEQARMTTLHMFLNEAQRGTENLGEKLREKGLISKSVFSSPTMILVGKVAGLIGLAGVSAFAGMKYEQRRSGRSQHRNRSTDWMGDNQSHSQGQHSDSPQSHPATSPLDGRHFNHQGNPGNEGNQTNHPSNRGHRNNATATA